MVVLYELRDGRMPASTYLVYVQTAMHTSLTSNSVVGESCTTVSMAHTKKSQLPFSVGQ